MLTKEQEEVASVEAVAGQIVLVDAVAGSGKTTTLTQFCRRQAEKGKSILLISFSRSDAEDARLRMRDLQPLVTVRTFDSIVHGQFRGGTIGYEMNPWAVGKYVAANWGVVRGDWPTPRRYLNQKRKRGSSAPAVGGFAPFMISRDVAVGAVPVLQALLAHGLEPEDADESQWQRAATAADAEAWWGKFSDIGVPLAKAVHETVNLRARGPDTPVMVEWARLCVSRQAQRVSEDVLLVDEVQDLNPNMVRWVQAQSHTFRMMCGDLRQHIFQFQHTANGFAEFRKCEGCRDMALTHSFRFGPEIASYVNSTFGTSLVGSAKDAGRVVDGVLIETALMKARVGGTITLLCRTNKKLAELLMAVVTVLSRRSSPFEPDEYDWDSTAWGRPRVCVMGLRSLEVIDSEARRCLVKGRKGYTTRLSEVKTGVDRWLCQQFGAARVLQAVGFMKEAAVRDEGRDFLVTDRGEARIVLSTIHRFKGKESDVVFLADDIERSTEDEECANILYTGLTRARKEVLLANHF
mgnify:CR=1 FL=1